MLNVLILGGNSRLGPHVVRALEGEHKLRITDINEVEASPHEYFRVDSSNLIQVMAAAEGMDAIVNLSVLRQDRQLAFDVNARDSSRSWAGVRPTTSSTSGGRG